MFHPPGRARCCRKRESKAAAGQERCSAFPRVDTIWLFFTKGILMRGQSSWSAAAAAAAPCSLSGGSTRDAEPAWVLPYPLRVKQKKPLPCRGLWSPLTKSNGVCHLNRLPVLLGSSNPGVRRIAEIHGNQVFESRMYNSSLLFIRLVCDCREVVHRALMLRARQIAAAMAKKHLPSENAVFRHAALLEQMLSGNCPFQRPANAKHGGFRDGSAGIV